MPLKNYRYHGPTSSVTLSKGDEHSLFDGKVYALPSDNPFVESLVRQRRLKEAPEKPEAKSNQVKPAQAKKAPSKTKTNEQENNQ